MKRAVFPREMPNFPQKKDLQAVENNLEHEEVHEFRKSSRAAARRMAAQKAIARKKRRPSSNEGGTADSRCRKAQRASSCNAAYPNPVASWRPNTERALLSSVECEHCFAVSAFMKRVQVSLVSNACAGARSQGAAHMRTRGETCPKSDMCFGRDTHVFDCRRNKKRHRAVLVGSPRPSKPTVFHFTSTLPLSTYPTTLHPKLWQSVALLVTSPLRSKNAFSYQVLTLGRNF